MSSLDKDLHHWVYFQIYKVVESGEKW